MAATGDLAHRDREALRDGEHARKHLDRQLNVSTRGAPVAALRGGATFGRIGHVLLRIRAIHVPAGVNSGKRDSGASEDPLREPRSRLPVAGNATKSP